MIAIAMLLSGVLAAPMPDCSIDENGASIGPWTSVLIESNGKMPLSGPPLSELNAELWRGGCKLDDPRLESALASYLAQMKSDMVIGPYMGLARVLGVLRVRSRPPEESVSVLMNDSSEAAAREREGVAGARLPLKYAAIFGYQLLLERGHADALRRGLKTGDPRLLSPIFSAMEGAKLKGLSVLKGSVVELFSSEDPDVQWGAVGAMRWVASSAREHKAMLRAFLAMKGRSDNARANAEQELKHGW